MSKAPIVFLGLFLIFAASVIAQESSIKLKVVTEQANIRLKPDVASIIIYQVIQGTMLRSLGKEKEWYHVEFQTEEGDRASGYVHESLVIEIESLVREEIKSEGREEIIRQEKSREPALPTSDLVIPSPERPSTTRITLSLSGGGNYFLAGDLNKGSEGLADNYSEIVGIQGEGDLKSAHLSLLFGGEISIPLSSRLFFGIGADYFRAGQRSVVEFQDETASDTFTTQPKIEAIPLRAYLSVYPTSFFYVKMGVEYYFANLSYLYHFQTEDAFEKWEGEAKARDIGYLGSLGLVIIPSSPINLFVELTGRYAPIMGFEGKDKHTNSTGLDTTEEGKLYFYKFTSSGKSFPRLFIWAEEPEGEDIQELREAKIDFSGLSIRVGLRIRF